MQMTYEIHLPIIMTSSAANVPNSDGMGPVSILSPKSNFFNPLIIASSVGSVPSRLLWPRAIFSSLDSMPNSDGMLPVSLFAPVTIIMIEKHSKIKIMSNCCFGDVYLIYL